MKIKLKKRKNILIIVTICILSMALLGGGNYVYSKYFYADKYPDLDHIAADKILKQNEDDYYVYIFLDTCPDCKQVSKKIREIDKKITLYAVDADDIVNILPIYDWKMHRSKYDKEIGVKEGQEIKYFDKEKAEKYLNSDQKNDIGHKLRYIEKIADETYMKKNPNAKEGYVYASLMTPYIDYSQVSESKDICIPGYPLLLHIMDSKIVEYYFDAPEVGEFVDNYLKEDM